MTVATDRVPLSSTVYTDLGATPMQVQIGGGKARIVLADSIPDPTEIAGMIMTSDSPITTFTGTGHLWGIATAGGAVAITNPTA